mgnify:FL=1
MKYRILTLSLISIFLSSCSGSGAKADAYGNFETDELTVSAETSGKLIQFNVEEGSYIKAGTIVGVIDTTQLHLKKKQLEAGITAISKKLPNEAAQLAVFNERIITLNHEIERVTKLVESKAAPSKQLDDMNAELEVTLKQKAAMASTLSTQTQGMLAEIEPLRYHVMQLEDQLKKSSIRNPIDGEVLTTLLQKGELAMQGRPLYKIASLNPLILRAYVSGDMLTSIKIGDVVSVFTDNSNESLKESEGKITWISSEAEFTPKIIQTRDERTSQVYAMKIEVSNDGSLKIGMPAEIQFTD